MNSFSPDMEKRLLGLLEQEIGIVGQILQNTRNQADLLRSDDLEAFSLSLDERQELIDKTNGLHQESSILMQSYLSQASEPEGKNIDAIDEASGRIHSALAECAAINDEIISKAKEKAGELTTQIGKLSLNRKSLGAYVQGVPNASEHFDKKT